MQIVVYFVHGKDIIYFSGSQTSLYMSFLELQRPGHMTTLSGVTLLDSRTLLIQHNEKSDINRYWSDLRVSPAEQKGSFDSKVVTYGSIDAPPSFKPAKKYSDVSGLPAVYTDPQVGSLIQLFLLDFNW